jgi:hypothetical protein
LLKIVSPAETPIGSGALLLSRFEPPGSMGEC